MNSTNGLDPEEEHFQLNTLAELPPQFQAISVEALVVKTDEPLEGGPELLPCIILRLQTTDNAGLVGTMVVDENLSQLMMNVNTATEKAVEFATRLEAGEDLEGL